MFLGILSTRPNNLPSGLNHLTTEGSHWQCLQRALFEMFWDHLIPNSCLSWVWWKDSKHALSVRVVSENRYKESIVGSAVLYEFFASQPQCPHPAECHTNQLLPLSHIFCISQWGFKFLCCPPHFCQLVGLSAHGGPHFLTFTDNKELVS